MPEPAPARVIRLEAMSALTLAAPARAEHRPAAMMMTGRRAMARGRRHRLKLTTAASISGQSMPSGLALQRATMVSTQAPPNSPKKGTWLVERLAAENCCRPMRSASNTRPRPIRQTTTPAPASGGGSPPPPSCSSFLPLRTRRGCSCCHVVPGGLDPALGALDMCDAGVVGQPLQRSATALTRARFVYRKS